MSDVVKAMEVREAAEYFVSQFSLSISADAVIDRIEALAAAQYRDTLPLKDGATELLEAVSAAGLPSCIATATYNSLVDSALTRLQIRRHFRFVITCEDVGAGKTKPDIFLQAAKRLGFAPHELLVIEDSLHCAQTAKAAGFPVCAVRDAYASGDWNALCKLCDMAVRSLRELTPLPAAWFDKSSEIE